MAKKSADTSNPVGPDFAELFGLERGKQEGLYPRAEWDEPRDFDPQHPPARCFALYNYRLARYEWSLLRVSEQPEHIRRDYFPPGYVHTPPPASYLAACAALRAVRARQNGPGTTETAELASYIPRKK